MITIIKRKISRAIIGETTKLTKEIIKTITKETIKETTKSIEGMTIKILKKKRIMKKS
jgi:hypothetical protein